MKWFKGVPSMVAVLAVALVGCIQSAAWCAIDWGATTTSLKTAIEDNLTAILPGIVAVFAIFLGITIIVRLTRKVAK